MATALPGDAVDIADLTALAAFLAAPGTAKLLCYSSETGSDSQIDPATIGGLLPGDAAEIADVPDLRTFLASPGAGEGVLMFSTTDPGAVDPATFGTILDPADVPVVTAADVLAVLKNPGATAVRIWTTAEVGVDEVSVAEIAEAIGEAPDLSLVELSTAWIGPGRTVGLRPAPTLSAPVVTTLTGPSRQKIRQTAHVGEGRLWVQFEYGHEADLWADYDDFAKVEW
jgi:hypothetical protein